MSGFNSLAAVGPAHELLHTEFSPFEHQEHRGISNFHHDEDEIAASTVGTFGAESVFRIPRGEQAIWRTHLRLKISSIENATYTDPLDSNVDPCLVPYFGYQCIDNVEIRHAGRKIYSFTGFDEFLRHQMTKDNDDAVAADQAVGGGLTARDRVHRSKRPQEFRIKLQHLFWNTPHQLLPARDLAHDLTLVVRWKPMRQLIQNPGGQANLSIKLEEQALSYTVVFLPNEIYSRISAKNNSATGLVYLAKEPVQENAIKFADPGDVTNAQTSYKLESLTGAADCIVLTCHRAQDIDGAFDRLTTTAAVGNNYVYDETNLRPVTAITLKTGQSDVRRRQTDLQIQAHENPTFVDGQFGTNLYITHFSLASGSPDNYGSRQLDAFSNLRYVVEWEKEPGNGKQSNMPTATVGSAGTPDPVLVDQDITGDPYATTADALGSVVEQQTAGCYLRATAMMNRHVIIQGGLMRPLLTA